MRPKKTALRQRQTPMSGAFVKLRSERHTEGKTLTGREIPAYYRNRFGVSRVQRLDVPPHWRVFYIAAGATITILDLTADG